MLSEDLLEIVAQTLHRKSETQSLEIKTAHTDCPKRLYDTLSSFSNQDSGGIILFGLDENKSFEVVGVFDVQSLQKKVTEQCNQMEPPVRAVFTSAEIDGKFVCAAEIPAIDISERPCYYKGAGRTKGSYVRVGDTDLPMTDYELYRYDAFRKHMHDDERPIQRAKLNSLNQELLQSYILSKRLDRPMFTKLSEEEQLEMLNLTKGGVTTLAALMNFGIYPQGFVPQLGITAIVVPGTEIGCTDKDLARFTDNKRIEGSIAEMVEGALAFCKRNMKTRTIIDKDSGMRTDITEYPINALREIILNALIHRDYSIHTEGTPIQLDFFSDRVEVHSPGSLYGRTTVEQLGYSHPDLRNPALAVMAEKLTDSENRYSGIPTIRREMKAFNLPEPVFENRRDEFVVTLYNAQKSHTDEQDSALPETERLLAYCKQPRSRKEIASFLNKKSVTYTIRRYVFPLLESGKLKMLDPDHPGKHDQKYYS